MNIAENLQQVLSELPDGVRLVAVSKFHPNEAIEEAYRYPLLKTQIVLYGWLPAKVLSNSRLPPMR